MSNQFVWVDIHPIGPHGFRAILIDSEGNRIALHCLTNSLQARQ